MYLRNFWRVFFSFGTVLHQNKEKDNHMNSNELALVLSRILFKQICFLMINSSRRHL